MAQQTRHEYDADYETIENERQLELEQDLSHRQLREALDGLFEDIVEAVTAGTMPMKQGYRFVDLIVQVESQHFEPQH